MRKVIFLILLLSNSFAQINLCKNPSFEHHKPFGLCSGDQINDVTGWEHTKFLGTFGGLGHANIFHEDCEPGMTLANMYGGQNVPFHPDGQKGYACAYAYQPPVLQNRRSFLIYEFPFPLLLDTINFSFQVSLTDRSSYAVSGLGASFYSELPISYYAFLGDNSAVVSEQAFMNKNSWKTFAATKYSPTLRYVKYMAIGVFDFDSNIDIYTVMGAGNYCTYYIDNVCVSGQALDCLNPVYTGIAEDVAPLTLSPSFGDRVKIPIPKGGSAEIINAFGEVVAIDKTGFFSFEGMPAAAYVIRVGNRIGRFLKL